MTTQKMKVTQIFRIDEGNLRGTELIQILGFVEVRYPHRKTPDLYIPPMATKDKTIATYHCCQEGCGVPDFLPETLFSHIERHAGRLFKRLPPLQGKVKPRIVVTLPPNPWDANDRSAANPDRHFTVGMYIESLKQVLAKQGIGVVDEKHQEGA